MKQKVSLMLLGLGIVVAYINRNDIIPILVTGSGQFVSQDSVSLPENAQWFDDYFTVQYIDSDTIAIGEPRYYQQNYSYLLLGNERALLFDTGTGKRDIKKLVDSLTDLPVVVMVSHFHYDHVGGVPSFNSVVVHEAQLNSLIEKDYLYSIVDNRFLGSLEGKEPPFFKIDTILEAGDVINLGGRAVRALHTPGHTEDSISLYDNDRELLFTGDFITRWVSGPLSKYFPGASLSQYRESVYRLMSITDKNLVMYTGHTVDFHEPSLLWEDLQKLHWFLEYDWMDQGMLPQSVKISSRMTFVY